MKADDATLIVQGDSLRKWYNRYWVQIENQENSMVNSCFDSNEQDKKLYRNFLIQDEAQLDAAQNNITTSLENMHSSVAIKDKVLRALYVANLLKTSYGDVVDSINLFEKLPDAQTLIEKSFDALFKQESKPKDFNDNKPIKDLQTTLENILLPVGRVIGNTIDQMEYTVLGIDKVYGEQQENQGFSLRIMPLINTYKNAYYTQDYSLFLDSDNYPIIVSRENYPLESLVRV